MLTSALDRGGSYSTTSYNNYVAAVGAKRQTASVGQLITLDAGSVLPVTLRVVAVNAKGLATTDENDLSVTVVVQYGNFHAEFGGDITGYYTAGGYSQPDSTTPPGGATARCADGTWSYSQNRSGTCSYHNGVWYFICPGLLCSQTPSPTHHDIEAAVAPSVGKIEVYKVHHHGSQYSTSANWLSTTTPQVAVIPVGNNSYGHPTQEALGRLHAANVRTYWTELGSGASPLGGYDLVAGTTVVQVAPGATTFTVTANGTTAPYATWEQNAYLTFTDDPLRLGMPVKAVHFLELRQRTDQLRARYDLSAYPWTDVVLVPGVTTVKALHLDELRTALSEVYFAAGRTPPSWSPPTIVGGTRVIAASEIAELRAAIVAIW